MIYVVIPCHKPRLTDLVEALQKMDFNDDSNLHLILVTTQPEPITAEYLGWYMIPLSRVTIVYLDKEINLAKWHNEGKDVAQLHPDCTAILYMESDVRISNHSIYLLWNAMVKHDLSQVGPDYYARVRPGRIDVRRDITTDIPVTYRVCQASMVPGDSSHRMDERLAWWYEADDLEYKCRLDKGSAIVGGAVASHTGVLFWEMPSELNQKANLGRKIFEEIWGRTPF